MMSSVPGNNMANNIDRDLYVKVCKFIYVIMIFLML